MCHCQLQILSPPPCPTPTDSPGSLDAIPGLTVHPLAPHAWHLSHQSGTFTHLVAFNHIFKSRWDCCSGSLYWCSTISNEAWCRSSFQAAESKNLYANIFSPLPLFTSNLFLLHFTMHFLLLSFCHQSATHFSIINDLSIQYVPMLAPIIVRAMCSCRKYSKAIFGHFLAFMSLLKDKYKPFDGL